MPDGTENQNKTGAESESTQVTFDDKQQEFINKMFDTRFAKITTKHQQELDRLKSEAEAAKAEAAEAASKARTKEGVEGADDEAKKQFKQLVDAEKAKTKAAELIAQQRETEAKAAKEEALKIKKEVAIARAATKQNFYELEAVTSLTWNNIEWDDEHSAFVVKENGQVKQNSSFQPMTLEEFYAGFAAARPYLVNGDVKGGANSTESSRASAGLVKYKSDLKTAKDKSDYITKFGGQKFEELPARPPA